MWLSALSAALQTKVAGPIPGQGTCLGCGFDSQSQHIQEATHRCFFLILMLLYLFLSSPLWNPLTGYKFLEDTHEHTGLE